MYKWVQTSHQSHPIENDHIKNDIIPVIPNFLHNPTQITNNDNNNI